MRYFKLPTAIIITALFLMACNSAQTDETASASPAPNEIVENEVVNDDDDFYARDNFDLNAVGALLEKSNDAENFEFLINTDNRANNLDLNGDGYVDYISVVEYEDRDTNQRGFTLFDRFGANDIQEIARLIFDRDRNDNRGARILLSGNEQIYGDNYNYETNWLDKSLQIADWAFSDRDRYYQSPYYYNNYPSNYTVYRTVETPVYVSRINEYYPTPIFIKTVNPAITTIKIKSSYKNKSMNKIFAKLAKPSNEQKEFRKNNPNRPVFVPVEKGERNNGSSKPERKAEKDSKENKNPSGEKKEKNGRSEDRGKPDKSEKENGKSDKKNDGSKKHGGGKPGGK